MRDQKRGLSPKGEQQSLRGLSPQGDKHMSKADLLFGRKTPPAYDQQ